MSVLTVVVESAVCRRAKAAWEAFYAAQLPELKEQKPGLKLMQYKSMIFDRYA